MPDPKFQQLEPGFHKVIITLENYLSFRKFFRKNNKVRDIMRSESRVCSNEEIGLLKHVLEYNGLNATTAALILGSNVDGANIVLKNLVSRGILKCETNGRFKTKTYSMA